MRLVVGYRDALHLKALPQKKRKKECQGFDKAIFIMINYKSKRIGSSTGCPIIIAAFNTLKEVQGVWNSLYVFVSTVFAKQS